MSQLGSKCFLYVIFLLFFVSCSSSSDKKRITDTSYTLEDYTECDLELFIPTEAITITLDSLIENTLNCERYSNLPIGFVFLNHLDNQENHIVTIGNIVDLHEFYYEQCSGLFFYKGYQFALIGDIISEFFIPHGESRKVLYIALGKEKNPKGRGEFFNSSWSYILEKDSLKSYYFTNCGRHWDSEKSD